jgi:hypothetical protein
MKNFMPPPSCPFAKLLPGAAGKSSNPFYKITDWLLICNKESGGGETFSEISMQEIDKSPLGGYIKNLKDLRGSGDIRKGIPECAWPCTITTKM